MHLGERLGTLIQSIKWGEWSLICLYLSLLSGIIVGLHYDLHEPYYSTSALDILIPYGAWFRSLHFYTSQLFFLLAIVHYLAVFNKSESYDTAAFILLVLCFPVILMLLFTGYVLRFDNTGFSAGMIAEHILEAIPLIGSTLNRLLFSISDNGLQRVYLHHVCSFNILFFLLAWDHLRRYRVKLTAHLPFIATMLIIGVVVVAPLDPELLGVSYITGPWFFLGLQELLRYLPPLIAGVLVPGLLIGALLLLRRQNRWYPGIMIFVGCWLLVYLLVSLLALFLHD
ncbi:MAG: cytochrome b N-terminal domain-containing protein [Desulfofustis sp.]|nr:cytochrome b N-terminal domain-containing protein [Desulfofustis sp.]